VDCMVRVRFRGVPATSSSVACHLLVDAGVAIVAEEGHPVKFEIGSRRCSTDTVQ
jgi:hypothetical protein